MAQDLFTINDSDDEAYASDGVSRYGAYLRDRPRRFLDWDEPTTNACQFAAAAWEIGSGPIMDPPYVEPTSDVVLAAVPHCDEDGRYALRTLIALPVPTDLRTALPARWQGWDSYGGGRCEPWDNDRPAVTTTLTVRIPFPDNDMLPGACYDAHGAPHVPTAQHAVRVLAEHATNHLAALLDAVTGRCPR